jgi:signal peptidase I
MIELKTIKSSFFYFFHIVARSFFIAILCLMVLSGFVFFLYMGDLLFISKDTNLKKPLFGTYLIVSPSMVPTINVNDVIIIKRFDGDQYDVGDIITFVSNDINYKGLLVTHRIVHKESVGNNESIYTTKGDNNLLEDSAIVNTSSICGKVLFRIPKVGYIKEFFTKPINYFICLLIPTLFFILYELFRILFVIRKKKI